MGQREARKFLFSQNRALIQDVATLPRCFFIRAWSIYCDKENRLTKSPEICIRCIGVSRIQFGCSEKKKKATLRASLSSLVSFVVPLLFWEGDAGGGNHNGFLFSSLLFPSLFPPLPSIRRPATQQQQCYRLGGGGGSSSSSCPDWVDITRGEEEEETADLERRRRREICGWGSLPIQ